MGLLQAIADRGLADLSPPELEHSLLELPTDRAEYIGLLQDAGDYPARSPIGQRVPDEAEVAALRKLSGRWRAIVLLDDARALNLAAGLFSRVFVLDPFYDSGALLYAAWHDPVLKDEHCRRLAEEACLVMQAAPLLNSGAAVLAPDHLPGSWTPRPGWTRPRSSEDARQLAAWALRTGLVLVYWADRLDGLACSARHDVIAALEVVLGRRALACPVSVVEPPDAVDATAVRQRAAREFRARCRAARRLSRHRTAAHVHSVADAIGHLAELRGRAHGGRSQWRLWLGSSSIPDPAMLIRRVLNGQDPEREPRLPRKKLRRRPMCLLAAQFSAS